tara:strand:- start:13583 stop:14011 length:429 start_codon:yes stop_codon:yes gene_type:complete
MPAPTNSDDIIDSRDVIARIDDLEDELRDLEDAADDAADDSARAAEILAEIDAWKTGEEGQELAALRALAAEASQYADDWQHGATLISLEYWPTYAQDLVEDIGDLPKNLPDYIVIDWEATAGNLKADYTEVEFDGATYLVR